jgi:hypothetical protein
VSPERAGVAAAGGRAPRLCKVQRHAIAPAPAKLAVQMSARMIVAACALRTRMDASMLASQL